MTGSTPARPSAADASAVGARDVDLDGTGSPPGRPPGLWKRAVLWLLLLAPLFFATYGFATWATARRAEVGSIVFGWEHLIPLWSWTIVPYWSIDLLYGFSLLVCASKRELDTHGRRLLTAQAIAVTCFLLFPLKFSVDRPAQDGVFGWMFDLLMGFDKPFNQAPSLHITLLVVLWVCYAAHARGIWKPVVHGWFALIGLSVLTTWQHHFIDLPTGMLAGWLCVWLWPDTGPSPLRQAAFATDPARWRLALYYLAGAVVSGALACLGGAALWLMWPAVALGGVAINYAWLGAAGFQKQPDGRLSPAVRWIFAPYLIGARLNALWWTRRQRQADWVADGVWLGPLRGVSGVRVRDSATRGGDGSVAFVGVVDLTAEIGVDPAGRQYASIPVLDLTVADPDTCRHAAEAIERMRVHGPVLVACALGYSRSATAVAAWLLLTGRTATVDGAVARLRQARPRVVLTKAHLAVLQAVAAEARIATASHPADFPARPDMTPTSSSAFVVGSAAASSSTTASGAGPKAASAVDSASATPDINSPSPSTPESRHAV